MTAIAYPPPLAATPPHVLALFQAALAGLGVEQLRVAFVDGAGRLLAEEAAATGGRTGVPTASRRIVIRALQTGADGLFLAHNHPSGDPTPSREDCDATRYLRRTLGSMEIRVHDHVVIAAGGVTSLADAGLL